MKGITVRDIIKSLEYEKDWWEKELVVVKSSERERNWGKKIGKKLAMVTWMRKIIDVYDANLDDIHRFEAGIKEMIDIAHDNVTYYSKYPEHKSYEEGYTIREKAFREVLGKEEINEKEIAYNLLKEQIDEHDKEKCKCDLADGGYGLCYAGQWLGGIISSSQVIRDLEK